MSTIGSDGDTMKKLLFASLLVLGFALPSQAQAVGYREWDNWHMAYVRADWTDASSASPQNIFGLSFILPAGQLGPFKIDCDLYYSQATNVADTFGIQFSVAPTNAEIGGIAATNATAFAAGTPANITGTGATAVVTFTPAVTSVLYAHIGGLVENASAGTDNTVNIQVTQGTAADVIVIKRGSMCSYHSMN